MDIQNEKNSRRNFVRTVATGTRAAAAAPSVLAQDQKKKKPAPAAPTVKGAQ